MSDERIVAVGLLTRADLDTLGKGFSRHFPVPDDDMFSDLIKQLDRVTTDKGANDIAAPSAKPLSER